mmetsp:Transcript_32963/g.72299  ORF Transcript_32963/g.72299 Transcript_32963/m.72299 type:complete len:243 (-) Transcript_32963:183-911(-)|eukprot:CAMPEP_0178514490 /NCGR_PEP_ID=MMETSP0696-20121128/24041_1 /TAXON_ID=265572 /ORGANISM="Extubocellulus spinifer, Strain CCMP396" /LENGTH=242 /DNA_ID=CAMNT_0020144569 /DNA_START=46 /DNA_END=774 /DNA_ORIENTATION=+
MGNTAVKDTKATELKPAPAGMHGDDGGSLAVAGSDFVTTKDLTELEKSKDAFIRPSYSLAVKGKGDDGLGGIRIKNVSHLKPQKAEIIDCRGDGSVVAIQVTEWAFNAQTTTIYRKTPAYKGQEKLDADKLKKVKAEGDSALYPFAQVVCTKLHRAEYSVFTKDGPKPMYVAKKKVAMKFAATVETAGDDGFPIATAVQPSMLDFGRKGNFYVAKGVDLVAVFVVVMALVDANEKAAGGATA